MRIPRLDWLGEMHLLNILEPIEFSITIGDKNITYLTSIPDELF